MFGMSLGEIFIVAIIAILFVGPEKLPDTLVKIAKYFRSFKNTINEAKESFDKELQIKELREEALNYKKQLTSSATDAIVDIKEEASLTKLDDIYEEFNSIHKESMEDKEEKLVEKKPKKKSKKKKSKKSEVKDDEK